MAFGAVSVFAQPPQGAPGYGARGGRMTEENVKQRVERLSESLGMSEEQKAKILEIELEAFKKNQVEMQKHYGDREAMRSYMQEQRELRDKQYKEVLSEEQMKKYLEEREQRYQEMRNRNMDRPPQDDPDRGNRGRGNG